VIPNSLWQRGRPLFLNNFPFCGQCEWSILFPPTSRVPFHFTFISPKNPVAGTTRFPWGLAFVVVLIHGNCKNPRSFRLTDHGFSVRTPVVGGTFSLPPLFVGFLTPPGFFPDCILISSEPHLCSSPMCQNLEHEATFHPFVLMCHTEVQWFRAFPRIGWSRVSALLLLWSPGRPPFTAHTAHWSLRKLDPAGRPRFRFSSQLSATRLVVPLSPYPTCQIF